MANLVAAEFDDQYRCQFHVFLGRLDIREIPVEHLVVFEANHELQHDPVRAKSMRYGDAAAVRRVLFDEMILIESFQHVVSDAARKGCYVIYVGVRDHGCHGGVDVSCFELVADVFRKKCDIVVVWPHRAPDQFKRPGMGEAVDAAIKSGMTGQGKSGAASGQS